METPVSKPVSKRPSFLFCFSLCNVSLFLTIFWFYTNFRKKILAKIPSFFKETQGFGKSKMVSQGQKFRQFLVFFSLFFVLLACSEKGVNYSTLDFTSLIGQAKKEGKIISVGMHDGWPTGQKMWDDLDLYYDIKDQDTDMGSAKILKCFRGDSDALVSSPDIGDIGLEYAREAKSQGLLAGYKTSYWDEIPSWAKDEDGQYIVSFTGTLAFLYDSTLGENAPKSFADLSKGTYQVGIASVTSGSTGQFSVYAAALAFGGNADNIEPGIAFFKQLAQQGRLVENLKTDNLFSSGYENKIRVLISWDFSALAYRDEAAVRSPAKSYGACIPNDGSVTSGYATIINKNAQNPYAAMLAREYILSDEGQLNIAALYATPIRSVKLPSELENKRIPRTQYTTSQTSLGSKFTLDLSTKVKEAWEDEVETEASLIRAE
jgi:putative spermidine/putrescine transport system substrate-binding protein